MSSHAPTVSVFGGVSIHSIETQKIKPNGYAEDPEFDPAQSAAYTGINRYELNILLLLV
jgi:hypothetical protein